VVVFVLTLAAGLAADLGSKHAAFASLLGSPPDLSDRVEEVRRQFLTHVGREPTGKEVLHQLHPTREGPAGIRLTLSTNPGVIFGLDMPRWAILAATGVVTIAVIVAFATTPADRHATPPAMGLILAGALGNLYDRLFSVVSLPGVEPIRNQVRDFLDFSAWHYPWIFNVADALLVVGVALVVLQSFAQSWRRRSAS